LKVVGNISVTVNKTNPVPNEVVRFTGTASPIEDIDVYTYVGGALIAMYTIFIKTLGVNILDVIPSLLGTVTVWKFKGHDTGATCPDITITVTAGPTEGHGIISGINLPIELAAGAWVTGTVTLSNDGAADTMALILKTEWDGKFYGSVFDLAAGASTTLTLGSGLIAMPNQDAVITLYACHAQPGGEFLIDSTEFKIDDTKTH
jgi:hypothetical protein